jgi:hypothetical protein
VHYNPLRGTPLTLDQVFDAVRPAIVAFMPTTVPRVPGSSRPELFPIVGTGFVLDDGMVVTNAHVIDALLAFPRPPDWPKDKAPFVAMLFHYIDKQHYPNAPTEGYAEIPLEVLGVVRVGDIQLNPERGIYYGPRRPDFNVVHVKAKGLPKIDVLATTDALREGTEVATVGFPMGTEALMAPGWLHQLCPFLQRGVISAVLPFTCKAPHSFVINVMSMGGASGSPVFLTDSPKVVGILNAGLLNANETVSQVMGTRVSLGITQTPTNFSYVVPSYFFASAIMPIKQSGKFELPDDTLSLDEMIRKANLEVGKQPGHNEPPDPRKIAIVPDDVPKINVIMEPTTLK